jgi:hypothetical protein
MQIPEYLSKHASAVLLSAGSVAVLATGAWWLIYGRRKKSDAERERERRLAVHASGRMTDGRLSEALIPSEALNPVLLYYKYSVAGVEYSAAQDVSSILDAFYHRPYLPGEAVIIKYDQHNPYNSIVVCELWSGLRAGGAETPSKRRLITNRLEARMENSKPKKNDSLETKTTEPQPKQSTTDFWDSLSRDTPNGPKFVRAQKPRHFGIIADHLGRPPQSSEPPEKKPND